MSATYSAQTLMLDTSTSRANPMPQLMKRHMVRAFVSAMVADQLYRPEE